MATVRLTVGDLTRYGFPKARFDPYTTKRIPIIDVGLVEALKRGRVKVKPALERLSPTGAVFTGGAGEPVRRDHRSHRLLNGLRRCSACRTSSTKRGEPRGRAGEPTAQPGLYFIGFTHGLRGHLFEAGGRPCVWPGTSSGICVRVSRRACRSSARPASTGANMCDQDHFDDDLKEFDERGMVTRRQFGVLLGAGVMMMLRRWSTPSR